MKRRLMSRWLTVPAVQHRHHKGSTLPKRDTCFLLPPSCGLLLLSLVLSAVFPRALAAAALPTSSNPSDKPNPVTPEPQRQHQQQVDSRGSKNRPQQYLEHGAQGGDETWGEGEQAWAHGSQQDLGRVGRVKQNRYQVSSSEDMQPSLLQLGSTETSATPAAEENTGRQLDPQQQGPQKSRDEDKESVQQQQQQAHREGLTWTSAATPTAAPTSSKKEDEPRADSHPVRALPVARPLALPGQIKPRIVSEPVKYSFTADNTTSPTLSVSAAAGSTSPPVSRTPPPTSAPATGPLLPPEAAASSIRAVDVSADASASLRATDLSPENTQTAATRGTPRDAAATATAAAAAADEPLTQRSNAASSADSRAQTSVSVSGAASAGDSAGELTTKGAPGVHVEEEQLQHEGEAQQLAQRQQQEVKKPQAQQREEGSQHKAPGDRLQQQPEELYHDVARQVPAPRPKGGDSVAAAREAHTSSPPVNSTSAKADAATNLPQPAPPAASIHGSNISVEAAPPVATATQTTSHASKAGPVFPEAATTGAQKPTEAAVGNASDISGGSSVVADASTAADSASFPADRLSHVAGSPAAAGSEAAVKYSAAAGGQSAAKGSPTAEPREETKPATAAACGEGDTAATAAVPEGDAAAAAAAGGEERDRATTARAGEGGDAAAAAAGGEGDAPVEGHGLAAAEGDSEPGGQQKQTSQVAAAPSSAVETPTAEGGAERSSARNPADGSAGGNEDVEAQRDSSEDGNGEDGKGEEQQQQQDAVASARAPAPEAGLLHERSLFVLLLLLLTLFIVGGLSAAGGIGGGSVFVAVLVGLGRVPVCYAIPISKVMVFSSSCSSVWCRQFLDRQATASGNPAVSRDWVNLLVPMALSGTLVGVLLNTVAPAAHLLLLLALLLLLLSFRTVCTAYKMYKEEDALRGEPAFDDVLPCSAAAAAYPRAAATVPDAEASRYMVTHPPSASALFPAVLPLPAFDAAARDYRQQEQKQQWREDSPPATRQQLPLPVFTRSAAHAASPPLSLLLDPDAAAGVDEAAAAVAVGDVAVEEAASEAGAAEAEAEAAPLEEAMTVGEAAVDVAGERTSAGTTQLAAPGGAPAFSATAEAAAAEEDEGDEESTAAGARREAGETATVAAAVVGKEWRKAERRIMSAADGASQHRQLQHKASRCAPPAAAAVREAAGTGGESLVKKVETPRAAPANMKAAEKVTVASEEGGNDNEREERGAAGDNGEWEEGQCVTGTTNQEDLLLLLLSPAADEARRDSATCEVMHHSGAERMQDAAAADSGTEPAVATTASATDVRISAAGNRDTDGERRAATDRAAATAEAGEAAESEGGEKGATAARVGEAAEGGRAAGGDQAPVSEDPTATVGRAVFISREGGSAGVDLLGYCEDDEQKQLHTRQKQQQVPDTRVELKGGNCGEPQQQQRVKDDTTAAAAAHDETAAALCSATTTVVAAAGRETEAAAAQSALYNLLDQTPPAGSSRLPHGELACSLATIDLHSEKGEKQRLQQGEHLKQQRQLQQQQQENVEMNPPENEKQAQQEQKEGMMQKHLKPPRAARGSRMRHIELQTQQLSEERQQQREVLQQEEEQQRAAAGVRLQQQQCMGEERRSRVVQETAGSLQQVLDTRETQAEDGAEEPRDLQQVQQVQLDQTQHQETTEKPQQLQQEKKKRPRQEKTGKQQGLQQQRKKQQEGVKPQPEIGEKKKHEEEAGKQEVGGYLLSASSSPPGSLQDSSTMYCTRTSSNEEPIAGVPLSPSSAYTSSFPLFYNLEDEEDLSHISVCLNGGGADGEELLAQQTQEEQRRLLQEFENTAARGIQHLLPAQQQTLGDGGGASGDMRGLVAADGGLLYSSNSSSSKQQQGSSRHGGATSIAARLFRARRSDTSDAALSASHSAAAAGGPRWLGSSSSGEAAAEAGNLYDREASANAGQGGLRGETCMQKSSLLFFLNPTHAQTSVTPDRKRQLLQQQQQQESGGSIIKGMAAAAQRLLSSSASAAGHRVTGVHGPAAHRLPATSQRGAAAATAPTAAGAAQELPLLARGVAADAAGSAPFPQSSTAPGAASSPQWEDAQQQSAAHPAGLSTGSSSRAAAVSRCMGTLWILLQQLREYLLVADALMFQLPRRHPHYLSLLLLMLVNVFCSVLLHGFLSRNKRRAAACAALAAVTAGTYVQLRFTRATLHAFRLTQQPHAKVGVLLTLRKAVRQLWQFAIAAAAAAAAVTVRGCRAVVRRLGGAHGSTRTSPSANVAEHQQQVLLQGFAAVDHPGFCRRTAAAGSTDSDFRVARSQRGGASVGARGIGGFAAATGKTNAPFTVELPLVNCTAESASSSNRGSTAGAGELLGTDRSNRLSVQNSVVTPNPIANLNPFSPPDSPVASSCPRSFFGPCAAPHATKKLFAAAAADRGGNSCCLQPAAAGTPCTCGSRSCGLQQHRNGCRFSAAAASPDGGEGSAHSHTEGHECMCSSCCSSLSDPVATAYLPASSPVVLLLTPFIAFFTGVFAGLVGVGGGVVFSPFLLLLGADPVVAVATAPACVVFTSGATSLQFLLIGRLPLLHALLFGAVAAVAAAAATCGMQRIRRVCGGRKSLIVGCVAAAVSLASLLVLLRCTEVWIHGEI